ncbi:hypothetical protein FRC17_011216 [Serendipita sp. 399]|nr:hypothetical protein FRC17_011216 [Serendipita sp. 399]
MKPKGIPRSKQSRIKVAIDENSIGPPIARPKLVNMHVNKLNISKTKVVSSTSTKQIPGSRSALGELQNVRKKEPLSIKIKENVSVNKVPPVLKEPVPTSGVKRRRSPSRTNISRPPRPLQQHQQHLASNVNRARKPAAAATTTSISNAREGTTSTTTSAPAAPATRQLGRMLQAMQARRQSQIIPSSSQTIPTSATVQPSDVPSSVVLSSQPQSPIPTSEPPEDDVEEEDVEGPQEDVAQLPTEPAIPHTPTEEIPKTSTLAAVTPMRTGNSEPHQLESLFEEMEEGDWLYAPQEKRLEYRRELERIAREFHDEAEFDDPTMVAEYAEEIFAYMAKLEEQTMPMPNYMTGQQEINWSMRATLIDWLLQVHLRYHMLPETLWIAVNILDRFLSKRVVSVVKLQLVGVTAIFIAAKYEEIVAPGVEEYVKMTENGYKKEEILKGEKIVLQTLDFRISSYCSPYSWVRRISKADDYNLQTRTLCKFLVELTLLDHRFLRAKPSLIAAIGMYSARKMLGHDWNDAFVYYSGRVEEELMMGHEFIVETLVQPGFENQYIYRKYTSKRFLKASVYACAWAQDNYRPAQRSRFGDKRPRLESCCPNSSEEAWGSVPGFQEST